MTNNQRDRKCNERVV
ncbi:hypothetical protein, partial [Escherichia coli]